MQGERYRCDSNEGAFGGLITNAQPTFAFLRQYDNVVPIWGIQRDTELQEFLDLERDPPALDDEMMETIRRDREALAGDFCRGCGYCMPCPQEIPISTAARIAFLWKRTPHERFLSDSWRAQMELIEECTECGQCKGKCPYELDVPNLLRKMLREYREFNRQHTTA